MEGYLRMLKHKDLTPVRYEFVVVQYSEIKKAQASGEKQETLALDEYLGKEIRLEFSGEIRCVSCGTLTKKSFNGGACYKCFINLAENDLCILKPETCHFHSGTCRDTDWGKKHCFKPHILYLANTSGLKVGITKENPYTKRWVDQGAVSAIPVLEVNSRLDAGLLEIEFAKYIADKTSWQKMISGSPPDLDLIQKRAELLSLIDLEKTIVKYKLFDNPDIYNIDYPILEYPSKKVSLKPDPNNPIEGRLIGIKGQYLLFPFGAINIRSQEGCRVSLSLL